MGYNRFYINVFINVIFIALSCLAFIFFLFEKSQLATALLFGFITLFFTGRLIYYVNRTNRILEKFLIYLRENDPSLAFTAKHMQKTFQGFHLSLQQITDELKDRRFEKELQSKYLQTIVENVNTGIISFDREGRVELINKTAKRLLGILRLQSISDINRKYPEFGNRLMELKPGEQCLERFTVSGKINHLSIKTSVLKTMDKQYTILSINDIKTELEDQELDSWKKLIRVITHEIMNSMTPIITLTSAIKRKFSYPNENKPVVNIKRIDMEDALASADIIEERSKGVIHFINQYRKLTKLPPLQVESIDISKLFKRIEYLFKEQLEMKNIRLVTTIQHKKTLMADIRMIEQVLINLVKNAFEALGNVANPVISFVSFLDLEHRIVIQVTDNGAGIPEKYLEQIFVPFFTTKDNGSGIGLSLSKQIMRLHKGEIIIDSKQGKGTTVNLKFFN